MTQSNSTEGIRIVHSTGWFIWVHLAILAGLGIYFRCLNLGTVPGVNGDECWYGNVALDLLHGRSTSLLTPNGNPVNPFYMGPTLLLHAVAEPSIVLLRLVPLICGLLALTVNAVLCDRVLGRTAAVLSTILLATLAIPIAYSRFAWDASQIPLVTSLLMLSSVLASRSPGYVHFLTAWGLFIVSVVIHPTCVFLGLIPLFSTQAIWTKWIWFLLGDEAPRLRKVLTLLNLAAVVIVVVRLGNFWIRGRPFTRFNPENLLEFISLTAELLNGRTIYRYLSGAECAGWPWIVGLVATLAVVALGFRTIYRSQRQELKTVTTGLLLGLAAFFLVAGPAALRPHYERYGVFLIVPLILLTSAAGSLVKLPQGFRIEWVAITLGYIFLGQFYVNYFQHFAKTGGESAATFLVSRIDPKQQAAERIASTSSAVPALVVTADFHCYQPLRYFLEGASEVRVERTKSLQEAREQILNDHRQGPSQVWVVDFAKPDGGRESIVPALAKEFNLEIQEIPDVTGQAAVLMAGP